MNILIEKTSPFINAGILEKLSTTDSVSWSARLGQSLPVEDEDTYLAANDQEAVEAITRAIKNLRGCKNITEWRDTFYDPPDVGDYNNDSYTSLKTNNATNKLAAHHEYGPQYDTLSPAQKRTLMNAFQTRKLREMYEALPTKMKIVEYSASPDVVDVFLKTMNEDYKRLPLTEAPPKDTCVIINLPWNTPSLYTKYEDIIESGDDSNYYYINIPVNAWTQKSTFYNKYDFQEEPTGNHGMIVYGNKSYRKARAPVFTSKAMKAPHNPPPINHNALQVPGLPLAMQTSLTALAGKKKAGGSKMACTTQGNGKKKDPTKGSLGTKPGPNTTTTTTPQPPQPPPKQPPHHKAKVGPIVVVPVSTAPLGGGQLPGAVSAGGSKKSKKGGLPAFSTTPPPIQSPTKQD